VPTCRGTRSLHGSSVQHRQPARQRAPAQIPAALTRRRRLRGRAARGTEERPNLVARLRGAAGAADAVPASHVDTALAHAASGATTVVGRRRGGFRWGRGALDMKSQTAARWPLRLARARGLAPRPAADLLVYTVATRRPAAAEAHLAAETHPRQGPLRRLLNEGAGPSCRSAGGACTASAIAERASSAHADDGRRRRPRVDPTSATTRS